ncbi:hypothetical protein MCHI_001641 [Candidatus Magnetoovum chiemensis]|nr:hypothetical protein MCHI_003037 [Candidatus Magnetoovum chiemensis]KJR42460.1 hypothetical protein MCHI_001641 [Candidatus Magnetoovum chiemensis]
MNIIDKLIFKFKVFYFIAFMIFGVFAFDDFLFIFSEVFFNFINI